MRKVGAKEGSDNAVVCDAEQKSNKQPFAAAATSGDVVCLPAPNTPPRGHRSEITDTDFSTPVMCLDSVGEAGRQEDSVSAEEEAPKQFWEDASDSSNSDGETKGTKEGAIDATPAGETDLVDTATEQDEEAYIASLHNQIAEYNAEIATIQQQEADRAARKRAKKRANKRAKHIASPPGLLEASTH